MTRNERINKAIKEKNWKELGRLTVLDIKRIQKKNAQDWNSYHSGKVSKEVKKNRRR